MLPRDPTELRPGPRPVCSVVADLRGLTALADADPAPGEPRHILWCGDEPIAATLGRLRAAGCYVHSLADAVLPAPFAIKTLYDPSPADRADHVRHALAQLHDRHRFDRIEFSVRGGLGFRAVQAKRARLAFEDVALVVRLDGCSQHDREAACRWPGGLGEVELDFIERYSFETADVQTISDADGADQVRGLGWQIRDEAEPPAERSPPPLVTVGIAHYNLGRYLPATLASLAAQTYPHIEVLVIDDGSTDAASVATVAELEARYPHVRFERQRNAGIGATRNRCLAAARGEFFIPMDADNLARPDMVERFVTAIRRNPQLSAMTCYHLAFAGDAETAPTEFLYACRPAGGPHTMASIRNVYGDANAIFRTADFRDVGGYETDRGTSCEDWEAFVKLVHGRRRIGVVPDHLFYYRHREAGFSRVTNWFANHQRVLRQFTRIDHLPAGEAAVLWTALLGFQQRIDQLTAQQQCLRYRLADRLHALWAKRPFGRRRSSAAGLTRRS